MKKLVGAIVITLTLIFNVNFGFAQNVDSFNFNLTLTPVSITSLPGLHSFVVAQHDGKWLVIGGRKDGLHARQPFNAFPQSSNNTDIYVVDPVNLQFWASSVLTLTTQLKEQLQSTNMNFYQDKDSLYIIGGYGYSATAADHVTYTNLISVDVPGLINAVINNQSIASYFKSISDAAFAVTGGQLGKIGNYFYLVGGHKFDGRYNPMGNPTYTQTYVSAIRKFKINNSGTQLSFSDYTQTSDAVHLHRRDYNLIPQIFPNGEEGYTISSGVFQASADLPYLYPVDVKTSGHAANTSFNQYLSNYHSAKVSLFDAVNNQMSSIFFGGMSQYYYSNGELVQDNNVPFVKTISRISRYSDGEMKEFLMPTEMPDLNGASAEFIINKNLPHTDSEIIKLSEINENSFLIGHIYGGIKSSSTNPFTNNSTSTTNASNIIYEVWLEKNVGIVKTEVNGDNPFSTQLIVDAINKKYFATLNLPFKGDVELFVTDTQGKLVIEDIYNNVEPGITKVSIDKLLKLSSGVYLLSFVFENKFVSVQKLVLP